MARIYLGFASNDKLTWSALGELLASGAEQALTKFRNEDRGVHALYAVCPQRNWSSGEPEVIQPPPVVKWKGIIPDQMTVEDVLEEAGLTVEEPAPPPRRSSQEAPPAEPSSVRDALAQAAEKESP